jgi:predicted nucleic acid-binding protein
MLAALRGRRVVAADLVRAELRRAVMRAGPDRIAAADAVLGRLLLVRLGPDVLDAAGRLGPPELRTLDAIHIQCALLLGDELDAFVTYDARQADAARVAGLRVEQPR